MLGTSILPRFNFNGDELEVVDETKLLGIIIRSDLSWNSHVTYMVTRANKKLWTGESSGWEEISESMGVES